MAWVVEAMTGRSGVAVVVSSGFDAYVRIHHRIHAGERWADVAPECLIRGVEPLEVVGSTLEFIDGDGNLDADHVDALAVMLADATSIPGECHYALWQGWGWVRPGSMMIVGDDAERVRSINDELAGRWHRCGTLLRPARSSRGGVDAT